MVGEFGDIEHNCVGILHRDTSPGDPETSRAELKTKICDGNDA